MTEIDYTYALTAVKGIIESYYGKIIPLAYFDTIGHDLDKKLKHYLLILKHDETHVKLIGIYRYRDKPFAPTYNKDGQLDYLYYENNDFMDRIDSELCINANVIYTLRSTVQTVSLELRGRSVRLDGALS